LGLCPFAFPLGLGFSFLTIAFGALALPRRLLVGLAARRLGLGVLALGFRFRRLAIAFGPFLGPAALSLCAFLRSLGFALLSGFFRLTLSLEPFSLGAPLGLRALGGSLPALGLGFFLRDLVNPGLELRGLGDLLGRLEGVQRLLGLPCSQRLIALGDQLPDLRLALLVALADFFLLDGGLSFLEAFFSLAEDVAEVLLIALRGLAGGVDSRHKQNTAAAHQEAGDTGDAGHLVVGV
jgi:hypothetical protein